MISLINLSTGQSVSSHLLLSDTLLNILKFFWLCDRVIAVLWETSSQAQTIPFHESKLTKSLPVTCKCGEY